MRINCRFSEIHGQGPLWMPFFHPPQSSWKEVHGNLSDVPRTARRNDIPKCLLNDLNREEGLESINIIGAVGEPPPLGTDFLSFNAMDGKGDFLIIRPQGIRGGLLPTIICLISAGFPHAAVITWMTFIPHFWPKTHHHR
jgi:hypothetical protein